MAPIPRDYRRVAGQQRKDFFLTADGTADIGKPGRKRVKPQPELRLGVDPSRSVNTS